VGVDDPAHQRAVIAQEVDPALVAQPFDDGGGALDVAEEDRYRPIRRRVAAEVLGLGLDSCGKSFDRRGSAS
jgi:hypothetical protein